MDDGAHHLPTKKNIMTAFRLITEYSQAGDVVFVHYSGHGGQTRNKNHTEASGYDSTIMVRTSCSLESMPERLIC